MRVCLSEFLHGLDFIGAKKSSEYVGTKTDNPAMILEENIPSWTRLTSIEDLQECFRIYEERVCIQDFPARYSPQFWLAHAALMTTYTVMCGFLEAHSDEELKLEVDKLLFDLWVHLLAAGPGSSHLEMMDIILKNHQYPLWKYMQTLQGDNLKLLISSLRTDFVYSEDVPAEHYATLMETHIDKIFKYVLRSSQVEEARRELMDLYAFYMTRMNHVPPHIGPRLSHLCFLICQRYELENPYMGRDDWVMMRNHLKVIKDIVTHPSFTVASEAQYRAPLTLEKIFQAVVQDQMLNIMFKDFMALLLTICDHSNSRKCKRLFVAYQTALFEQIDFKKGFEETPYWMFDQCMQTLGKLSKTVKMETHVDELIINAVHLCLIKFIKLSTAHVSAWHELIVNFIVSGRTLLVLEAGKLLSSSVLEDNKALNWKTHEDQGRLLIDIVTDVPASFFQANEEGSQLHTLQAYGIFLRKLLSQIKEQEVEGRVRQNVHKCLLKCMEKDPPLKSALSLTCIDSGIPDLTDEYFMKEVLFSVDTLFKDERCPDNDETLTRVVTFLLKACLQLFRSKRYIPVDVNSLLMSVCLTSLSVNGNSLTHVTEASNVIGSKNMWMILYDILVKEFLDLHKEKGTLHSIASLVPQVILAIQDSVQRQGTIPERCVSFLLLLTTICFQLIRDHLPKLLEVFFDSKCYTLSELLVTAYAHEPGPFLAIFQDIFVKTLAIDHEGRHHGMMVIEETSNNHVELFLMGHTCQLLGTYSTETERTQHHILNIILNIARKSPGLVATYFTLLVDDTKFPPESLVQKAPVFQCLAQYNEDISQRVIDYLMKHIDSKKESVSVVAMETLVPIIKDKPGFIHKQKARFKTVWKSSNVDRVKQLCAQLVPEIKANNRKPIQKASSNKSQTSVSKDTGKQMVGPIVNKNPPVQIPARLTISDKGSKIAISLTSKSNPTSVIQVVNLDAKKELTQKGEAPQKQVTAVGDQQTKERLMNDDQINCKSVEQIKGATFGAGDKVYGLTETHVIYNDLGESLEDKGTVSDSAKADTHKESPNNDDRSIMAIEGSGEILGQTIDKADGTPEKSQISDRPKAVLFNEGTSKYSSNTMISDSNDRKPTPVLANEETNNKSDDNIKSKDVEVERISGEIQRSESEIGDMEKTLTGTMKPTVYLCSCARVRHLMEKFSVKLREAGYANAVKDVSEEDTGELFTDAKVVIVCLDDYDGSVDYRLIKQISDSLKTDVPIITIKFQNAQWHVNVHRSLSKDTICIRLYAKPGESKLPDTNWAKYKFCEVLMHLSYLGITPDESFTTEVSKSLWKNDLSTGQIDATDGVVVPDIFMSYHWGKLRQVEPLYKYLSKKQYSCWFGAYQMRGAESLYNKIQQGLQCCRVILACITNNYHLSEICLRDIRTARRLDREIIPVLVGDIPWPLDGEIGYLLDKRKFQPVTLNLTQDGKIDLTSAGISILFGRLKQCLVDKESDELDDTDEEVAVPTETNAWSVRNKIEDDISHVPKYRSTIRKSNSLYDVDSGNLARDGMKRNYSNLEHRGDKRMSYPGGVLVDEDRFDVRSVRSKSCNIL